MLTQLNIHGLAIIESLSIDFSSPFNVITGETGAGKSILIKALGLLFGAKAAPEVVRKGSDHAEVCGVFDIPAGHKAFEVLQRLGIPYKAKSSRDAILVRRQVTAKGRSQGWINDTPVTMPSLKELGYTLIDIFGQFENQKLFNPAEHLGYVDKFCKAPQVRAAFETCYTTCLDLFTQVRQMLAEFRAKIKDEDYLRFRHQELAEFAPALDDYSQVLKLCKEATSLLSFQEKIAKTQALLDQPDTGRSLSAFLWESVDLLTELAKLNEERFSPLRNEAKDIATRLDELSFEVGRLISGEDFDENQLQEAESRLARYQELFRRFSVAGAEDLVAAGDRLERDLAFIESFEATLRDSLGQLKKKTAELEQKADLLSRERHNAVSIVKKRIEDELSDLNMKGAIFEVEFQPATNPLEALDLDGIDANIQEVYQDCLEVLSSIARYGREKAQFLFSANLGEKPYQLQKIASGGEVSRIMLALKKALAAGAETCVLVFDEIDSGISGRAADVVGKKLKELSENFQIVCISHLPQVAAYADKHYLVEKQTRGGRTESRIVLLSEADRAKEIARLLSGTEITKPSLENAKELVRKAKKQKSGKDATRT